MVTGSGRSASRNWLTQRLTAAVMAGYSVMALGLVFAAAPFSYESWQSLLRDAWIRGFTVLFAVCLAWHAAIGIHDILLDYIKGRRLRSILLALSSFVLAAFVGKTVITLWS